MKNLRKLENNIMWMKVGFFTGWGRLYIPVLALFYIASQVTLPQFSFIMGAFFLTQVVLEIPSGVVADFLGKRNTIVVSRLLFFAEVAILAFGYGFELFLIAKIISGFALSLNSGARESFIFDTLDRQGKASTHKKVVGDIYSVMFVAQAIFFSIGAYIFTLDAKLPALISLIPMGLSVIAGIMMVEPYPHKRKISFSDSHAHLLSSVKLYKKPVLVYAAIAGVLFAVVTQTVLTFNSVYFDRILFPIALIGVVAAVGHVCQSVFSKKVSLLTDKFRDHHVIMVAILLYMAVLVGMAFLLPWYGVGIYFLGLLLIPFYKVFLDDLVQSNVERNHRATMTSLNNIFISIATALFFFGSGFVVEFFGLSGLYVAVTIILAILGLILHRTFSRSAQF